jgi:hypothetical protein
MASLLGYPANAAISIVVSINYSLFLNRISESYWNVSTLIFSSGSKFVPTQNSPKWAPFANTQKTAQKSGSYRQRVMGISSTSSAWEADNLGSVGDIAQMLAFGPLPSVRDSRIQVSSGVNRAN